MPLPAGAMPAGALDVVDYTPVDGVPRNTRQNWAVPVEFDDHHGHEGGETIVKVPVAPPPPVR